MIDPSAITTGAFTLGGAAVGFAGGTANQLVRTRQERTAQAVAREGARADRRRQVLTDFEQALARYIGTVWRVHQADFVAAKASGVWVRPGRSPHSDLELLECARHARQLAEWIVDDDLRERFQLLDRQVTIGLKRLASEAAAVRFEAKISALFRSADERLGQLLRPLL
ncbi:MAG: hypothetical protein ACRENX_08555 [Candidatus Dormibacteria bacterium]